MKKNEDTWQIVHIPGKPSFPPNQQPTVEVYACEIEPKFANTLVRRLCRVAPFENLRHVKRVRKRILEEGKAQLTVILCLALRNEDRLSNLPQDVQELVDSYQLSPFIAKVSKYAATSKEEWEEQCKLWPTSYHPPTYNIDGITGFSDEDSQSICKFVKLALELAISSDNSLVNAAVIVDPSVRQVIASATDQIHSWCAPGNFTGSETVRLAKPEAVFHPQNSNGPTNGGEVASRNASLDKPEQSWDNVACMNPWQWILQQNETESCNPWHPLRHAAMVAIESSASRDRCMFPGPMSNQELEHLGSFSADSPSKRQKTSIAQIDNGQDSQAETIHSLNGRPYLCTGYDIFLLWEPCMMCSMALVHQRIRRIFYAFPNPIAGSLGSVHRLQGEKSLNHHYAVFRVMLPEEILGKHSKLLSNSQNLQNGKQ